MNNLKILKRLVKNLVADSPPGEASGGSPDGPKKDKAQQKAQQKARRAAMAGLDGAPAAKPEFGNKAGKAAKAAKLLKPKRAARPPEGLARNPHRGPKAAGMLLAAAVGGHAGAAGVVHETQVYKTTDRGPLNIEIYRPSDPPPPHGRPCVVFFHGGAWRRGSTKQFMAFSTLLAQRGVIGMSAEYRLLQDGDGDIPFDSVRDARSAMRWVYKNAAQLGCDTSRIGAGGGSAGGHLALMTAMKTDVDDPKDDLQLNPRPAALVLLNAPLNFDDYTSSVPVAERRRLAPYYLLDNTLPPTLMMQGTKDQTVSYKQAVAFRDKAQQVGVKDLTLIPFEGRKHGFFNKGKGEPGDFDAAADDMMDFLHRLGWL